jgi:hypothetical protein
MSPSQTSRSRYTGITKGVYLIRYHKRPVLIYTCGIFQNNEDIRGPVKISKQPNMKLVDVS